jgi:diguanylate cyclase (GGDEF)-like protein
VTSNVERANANGDVRALRRPAAGWPVVVGVGAVAAVYLLVVGFHPASPRAMVAFGDLSLVAASAFGAVACVVAYRRVNGSARYGWALIGAGSVSWMIGQSLWSFYELVTHWLMPYPSLADVAYLLCLPLIVAGMAVLIPAGRGKLRTVLDVLIVSASLLVVSWAFIMEPSIYATGGTAVELVVGLAYPIGDVAMVTMALILLGYVARSQRGVVGMLAAGALAMSVSHGFYAYLVAHHSYVAGTLVDFGGFGGFLLVGLAALSTRTGSGRRESDQNSTLWIVLPYAPLVVAVATSVVLTLLYGQTGAVVYFLDVLIVALVVARQLVSVRDNLVLTRQLGVAVRDLRSRERQLQHLAFHDQLTGLANRVMFLDRAEHAVARQNREGYLLALLYIDLDGFKQVNDELGHWAGDRVLATVAGRLRDCVDSSDTLARLGGDEFAILTEGLRSADEAVVAADRVTQTLQPPYDVDGHAFRVTGSVGVALRHAGSAPVEDMLHRADGAMYAAKLAGKGRFVVAPTEPERPLLDAPEGVRHAAQ